MGCSDPHHAVLRIPVAEQLSALALNLRLELDRRARSLTASRPLRPWVGADPRRVDAASRRLQSLDTGLARCPVPFTGVLTSGTPDGAAWHRRVLERLGARHPSVPRRAQPPRIASLQEWLRYRQLGCPLDADALRRWSRCSIQA